MCVLHFNNQRSEHRLHPGTLNLPIKLSITHNRRKVQQHIELGIYFDLGYSGLGIPKNRPKTKPRWNSVKKGVLKIDDINDEL